MNTPLKYSHTIQGGKNVFAKNVSLIPNNIFAQLFPLFCKSFPPIFAKASGYYPRSFVIRDFDLWFPVFIELPRHFFFNSVLLHRGKLRHAFCSRACPSPVGSGPQAFQVTGTVQLQELPCCAGWKGHSLSGVSCLEHLFHVTPAFGGIT